MIEIIDAIKRIEPSTLTVSQILDMLAELSQEMDGEVRDEFMRLLTMLVFALSVPVIGEVG